MPEFVLDHGSREGRDWFHTLDAFTRGYIEAMFFTSTGTGDDAELEDATVDELAADTRVKIITDCENFRADPLIVAALDTITAMGDADDAALGRDFWYTRCGHGCGYWEHDGPAWQRLDLAAKRAGNRDLYRGDDGLLYLS